MVDSIALIEMERRAIHLHGDREQVQMEIVPGPPHEGPAPFTAWTRFRCPKCETVVIVTVTFAQPAGG